MSLSLKRPIFRNNQASSPSEAILRGLFKQVRELLKREADPNEPINNKTAIMLCTFISDVYWAKSISFQLLEYGAQIDAKDKLGFNALHFCVIKNRKDLLEIFFDSVDFDLNVKNSFGFTALHYAVDSEKKLDILEMLITEMKKYKYSLDSENKFHFTPLMESVRHLNFRAVEILIENGAKINLKFNSTNFMDYFNSLKQEVERTPHYRINKLKKNLPMNQNDELLYHDSIIKTIEMMSISVAPDYDFRNNSIWVTERPKSCITLNTFTRSDEETSWKTFMPSLLNHMEDQFTKSYRKNFGIEQILHHINRKNRDGLDGPEKGGKGKNNMPKKNGLKSKINKKMAANTNQDKIMKRTGDLMKSKY